MDIYPSCDGSSVLIYPVPSKQKLLTLLKAGKISYNDVHQISEDISSDTYQTNYNVLCKAFCKTSLKWEETLTDELVRDLLLLNRTLLLSNAVSIKILEASKKLIHFLDDLYSQENSIFVYSSAENFDSTNFMDYHWKMKKMGKHIVLCILFDCDKGQLILELMTQHKVPIIILEFPHSKPRRNINSLKFYHDELYFDFRSKSIIPEMDGPYNSYSAIANSVTRISRILYDPYILTMLSSKYYICSEYLLELFCNTKMSAELNNCIKLTITRNKSKFERYVQMRKEQNISNTKFLIFLIDTVLGDVINLLDNLNQYNNFKLLPKFPTTWFGILEWLISRNLHLLKPMTAHIGFNVSFPFSDKILFYYNHFLEHSILTGCNRKDRMCELNLDKLSFGLLMQDLTRMIISCDNLQNNDAMDFIIQYLWKTQRQNGYVHLVELLISNKHALKQYCKCGIQDTPLGEDFIEYIFTSNDYETELQSRKLMDRISELDVVPDNIINLAKLLVDVMTLKMDLGNTETGSLKLLRTKLWKSFVELSCIQEREEVSTSACPYDDGSITMLIEFMSQALPIHIRILPINLNLVGTDFVSSGINLSLVFVSEAQGYEATDEFKTIQLIVLSSIYDSGSVKEIIKFHREAEEFFKKLNVTSLNKGTVSNFVTATDNLELPVLLSIFSHQYEQYEEIPHLSLTACCEVISTTTCSEFDCVGMILREVVIKRVVEAYAVDIYNKLINGDAQQLISHDASYFKKLFFTKCLVRKYGISFLETIEEKVGWLNVGSNSRTEEGTFDLFRIVGDDYVNTRKKIQNAEELNKLDPVLVMLHYYHVTHGNPDNCSKPEVINTRLCVQSVVEPEIRTQIYQLKEERLFNQEQHLWGSSGQVMYMLYCYLQRGPTNTVTHFLQDIYQHPIRAKLMYLPTMREDIVNQFKQHLGEKFATKSHHPYSWYTCSNGHIYVINNCGEPLETAMCHCGSTIGGIKHNLVKGNRRLEEFKFNEKGYNLPPVDIRGQVDSERCLNSLALGLMRWLLHASFAVSPKVHRCSEVFGVESVESMYTYLSSSLQKDYSGIAEVLQSNSDETAMWLVYAIHYIFSQHYPTGHFNYIHKRNREQLETIYLQMITPLLEGAKDIVQHCQEVVVRSDDEFTKHVLSLSYPEEQVTAVPDPCHIRQFLEFRQPVIELVREQFQNSKCLYEEFPITGNFLLYQKYIPIIGSLSKLLKTTLDILREVNHKISKKQADKMCLKDFQTFGIDDFIVTWNLSWGITAELPHLIDNIHIGESYKTAKLTTSSPLSCALPSSTGPGVGTWYLLNLLAKLHNLFATTHLSHLTYFTASVQPQPQMNEILCAFHYYCHDKEHRDLHGLEEGLSDILDTRCLEAIDIRSLKLILFKPLKDEKVWFKALTKLNDRQLDRPRFDTPSEQLSIDQIKRKLHELEVLIQVSSSDNNYLSVEELCSMYNIHQHIPDPTKLYYQWHETWLHLSQALGHLYQEPGGVGCHLYQEPGGVAPTPQCAGQELCRVADRNMRLLCTHPTFHALLHMLIVEWVLHFPGFDSTHMQLREALDLFAEQHLFTNFVDVINLVPENMAIEQGIALWDALCQRRKIMATEDGLNMIFIL